VGTDAAGRRQYRYHDRRRELRDREKFDRVLEFGRTLPKIRAVADRHLRGPATLTRERVLAAAIRLKPGILPPWRRRVRGRERLIRTGHHPP
jgi:DNA topoisomerase-1